MKTVKSSTEFMLYVVLTMPTLNKAYLFIYLLQYPPKNLSFKALNFLKDSFFEGAILSENAVHSTTVFDTLFAAMFLANRSRPSNQVRAPTTVPHLVLSVIEIK
jgi:hypothetical protein